MPNVHTFGNDQALSNKLWSSDISLCMLRSQILKLALIEFQVTKSPPLLSEFIYLQYMTAYSTRNCDVINMYYWRHKNDSLPSNLSWNGKTYALNFLKNGTFKTLCIKLLQCLNRVHILGLWRKHNMCTDTALHYYALQIYPSHVMQNPAVSLFLKTFYTKNRLWLVRIKNSYPKA